MNERFKRLSKTGEYWGGLFAISNFTKDQKSAFLHLAEEYDLKVYEIASKGSPTEIAVSSEEEALLLNKFASIICERVNKDLPDTEGVDENISADAEMAVFMVTDILSEAGFDI